MFGSGKPTARPYNDVCDSLLARSDDGGAAVESLDAVNVITGGT